MNKQEFFSQLTEKLSVLGIDSETTQKHIQTLDGFFKGLSDKEIEKRISDIGDINDFAVSVYEIIKKSKKSNSDLPDSDAPTEKKAQIDNSHKISEDISEQDTERTTDDLDIPWPVDDDFLFDSDDNNSEAIKDIADSDIKINRSHIDISQTRRTSGSNNTAAVSRNSISQPVKPIRSKEEEEKIKHNKTVFWTVVAVFSPIWLFLLGVIAGLFGCAYFLIGLLALVSVVGMVGIVIAGTGMALFGIVYGITQLSVKPIGLYEIGLGIAIAGVTMLAGILLYNFIIRIMPIIFRELIRFTKYIISKLKELFIRLKRECVGE